MRSTKAKKNTKQKKKKLRGKDVSTALNPDWDHANLFFYKFNKNWLHLHLKKNSMVKTQFFGSINDENLPKINNIIVNLFFL